MHVLYYYYELSQVGSASAKTWHSILQTRGLYQNPEKTPHTLHLCKPIEFPDRKGIVEVPMSHMVVGGPELINGITDKKLAYGTALVTNSLSGCMTYILIDYEPNYSVTRIAFTHVVGGRPENVDWAYFAGSPPAANVTRCLLLDDPSKSIAESVAEEILQKRLAHLREENVILCLSTRTAGDNRNFAIASNGQIGAYDEAKVVPRKSHGVLPVQYRRPSPGLVYGSVPEARKLQK